MQDTNIRQEIINGRDNLLAKLGVDTSTVNMEEINQMIFDLANTIDGRNQFLDINNNIGSITNEKGKVGTKSYKPAKIEVFVPTEFYTQLSKEIVGTESSGKLFGLRLSWLDTRLDKDGNIINE